MNDVLALDLHDNIQVTQKNVIFYSVILLNIRFYIRADIRHSLAIQNKNYLTAQCYHINPELMHRSSQEKNLNNDYKSGVFEHWCYRQPNKIVC